MSAGLLIARLILGLGLASHGSQKLFGWFGGQGPRGTGGFFEKMGFRPGHLFAIAAGLCEFFGGILTAAGFLGGIGPALMVTVMLVAIFTVHLPNGFFNENKGWELPGMFIAGALAVDFGGFGAYSLDALWRVPIAGTAEIRWILIGVAIVLAAANVAIGRARPQQPQAQST